MSRIDSLDHHGAIAMKDTIQSFWRALGFTNVKVELHQVPGMTNLWAIRSNLVNGMPPE